MSDEERDDESSEDGDFDPNKAKGKAPASDDDDDEDEEKEVAKDEEEDDDDDEEEEDEEEEEESTKKKGKGKKQKRKRTGGRQYIDDVADDDDEDEEDSDEDDDAGDRKKKKKKKRKRDEEDDDEAELDDEEAERLQAQVIEKRQANFFARDDLTEEEITERYRQQRSRAPDADYDDDAVLKDDQNARNARLPDAMKDPKVWSVKVANGTEKTVVMQLMVKWAELAKTSTPINITAAYWNEQALGYIYLEAYKAAYVTEALSGLRGVYHSKMALIPVKEMVDTVTVIKQTNIAKEGGWAQIKRGKYKGDIAQVLKVDHNKGEVEVKLVPRVDTTDYSEFDESEANKRKKKFVAPRRPFDPANYNETDLQRWDIKDERDTEDTSRNVYVYDGFKFKGSFLVKWFSVKGLTLGADVQPELDDLKIFEQGAEDDEDGAPAKALTHMTSVHKRAIVLKKGDVVRVKSGELLDLLGDVDNILGKTVVVKPKAWYNIKQSLEFADHELEKYFENGDHVKVVSGRRAGVTGTVVKVEGEIIQILTDVSRDEIRVFSSDLQDSNEISSGLDVVGAFRLYDLILLESASTSLTMPSVGVVIQLEKDVLQVLDNHNKIRQIRPADAQPHKKSATAVALDSEQQTIGSNDVVRVVDGQYKGQTATVRHIFRAFLFLFSPAMMNNAGTFVVRSRQVTLMGQSKHKENDTLNTAQASACYCLLMCLFESMCFICP